MTLLFPFALASICHHFFLFSSVLFYSYASLNILGSPVWPSKGREVTEYFSIHITLSIFC